MERTRIEELTDDVDELRKMVPPVSDTEKWDRAARLIEDLLSRVVALERTLDKAGIKRSPTRSELRSQAEADERDQAAAARRTE